jgi:hypothetical protein
MRSGFRRNDASIARKADEPSKGAPDFLIAPASARVTPAAAPEPFAADAACVTPTWDISP